MKKGGGGGGGGGGSAAEKKEARHSSSTSTPPVVVLFGSFTEDEIKSRFWQSSKDEKTSVESQVGSRASVQESSLGSCGNELSIQFGSLEAPLVSVPSNFQKQKNDGNANLGDNTVSDDAKQNGNVCQTKDLNSSKSEGTKTIDKVEYTALNVAGEYEDALSKLAALPPQSLGGVSSKGLNSNGNFGGPWGTHNYGNFAGPWGTHNFGFVHTDASHDPLAFTELRPRGLINAGNLCFLNATLQALLACSPFVQLLQELRMSNFSKVEFPTLTAFYEFIHAFGFPSGVSLTKKDVSALETGWPFSPVMFEVILKNFTPDVPSSMSGRPRQEDAQEFLSYVMHQMHDELLKLEGQSNMSGGKSSLVSAVEDDEWETVGPKNKSAVTRTQTFVPSKLSLVFGGQLHSVVKAKGNKPSATVEPFLLLHLDINHETVYSIEDALHLFSAKETLDEYRAPASGKVGVASARKSVSIRTLPKILVLHLKRFCYVARGSTKLHKPVRFPLELVLNRDLLYSNTEGRKYELVSTITHHGKEASKGHYTADARYPSGQWLRFDDASVTTIGTGKVLHDQAYILFYKQL